MNENQSEVIDLIAVAKLARLSINPDDHTQFAQKTNNLIQLIKQMQTVDTDGIAPMAHPLAIHQPTRQDESHPCCRDTLQQCAPPNSTSHHLYLVPQVIDDK